MRGKRSVLYFHVAEYSRRIHQQTYKPDLSGTPMKQAKVCRQLTIDSHK